MMCCEQAPGMNMLQHGRLVHAKYRELINQCAHNTVKYSLVCALYNKFKLPPAEVLKKYHFYHDCGKHLCLTIDANGKKHYPNHAEISAKQYSILQPEDLFTTSLIKNDMAFHTARGEDLVNLCKNLLAPILYFTAWAEIMANAEMFGGEESESFKIKKSRLIQAGKKLLKGVSY